MHKKHNSHHIFLLLGLLVLLFLLVFGLHYFRSEYSFGKKGIIINNTQNYDDGISVGNPFSEPSVEYGKKQLPRSVIPMTDPSIEDYIPSE